MLLSAHVEEKSIGTKHLFAGLKLHIEASEKIAIIGRNGVGKTTLFHMLTGEDTDYTGSITPKPGINIIATAQEHSDLGNITVMSYILNRLPEYKHLKHVIDTYPETMGDNLRNISVYSEALDRFGTLDYYSVEDRVLQSLDDYQLADMMDQPMTKLSGGQKRFVELIIVEHSFADLALIDEPTNHMDYVAKAAFLDWFQSVKRAVVVISHDRDVLQHVNRIIEVKDQTCVSFTGNYNAYLKQNAHSAGTKMHDYEITQRRISNLRDKVIQFRRLKEKARDPDTIKQFKRRESRAATELAELEKIEKPSFWIDRESATNLKKQVSDNYDKYKAKNITLHKTSNHERHKELLRVESLQLGYSDKALFKPVNFIMRHGGRLRLVGRNGAGKTTLVKAIMDEVSQQSNPTRLSGKILCDSSLRLSTYEQESSEALLSLTLSQAITHIYEQLGFSANNELVMRTMGNYLFNPHGDQNILVKNLSGGQKARLQIIKMLAGDPNVLILDEPTNHLDLPSIEELEVALQDYHGALIYVSHDSYLAHKLAGAELKLLPA